MPTYSSVGVRLLADLALLTPRGRADDRAEQAGIIRECSPIMTFSIAVIVENRRMFWNVRAIPAFMTMSGRAPVMSRPSNSISPNVGR